MSAAHVQRAAGLQLLAGAAIIGSNGLMVRMAAMPPTAVAFWRMLLAGVLLAALVSARHGWQPLPRKAWWWLAVPVVAFAVDLWMWHKSILLVGPGLSTLLANAQVFFMAIAGVLLFGERLNARFVAGVLLAFSGLWLLLGADWATLPPQYRWGVWLGLGAGVCYAAYNVGIKRSQAEAGAGRARVPVEQVLCYAAFGSALCLGLIGWAEGEAFAPPSLRSWGVLLALAGVRPLPQLGADLARDGRAAGGAGRVAAAGAADRGLPARRGVPGRDHHPAAVGRAGGQPGRDLRGRDEDPAGPRRPGAVKPLRWPGVRACRASPAMRRRIRAASGTSTAVRCFCSVRRRTGSR